MEDEKLLFQGHSGSAFGWCYQNQNKQKWNGCNLLKALPASFDFAPFHLRVTSIDDAQRFFALLDGGSTRLSELEHGNRAQNPLNYWAMFAWREACHELDIVSCRNPRSCSITDPKM